jgi:hypothetical protein
MYIGHVAMNFIHLSTIPSSLLQMSACCPPSYKPYEKGSEESKDGRHSDWHPRSAQNRYFCANAVLALFFHLNKIGAEKCLKTLTCF